MSFRCRLTAKATRGLEDIIEYVAATFGARAAEQVLDRLEAAFEKVARNPHLGHVRQDLTADERVRFWPVGPTDPDCVS